MFRELMRKNKKISTEECIHILKTIKRGVLSVIGDDEYPYGMPMNHWYDEEDGNIYFHCGKSGHRLDALQKSNKVCFCTYDDGYRNEGEWALNIKSVIVFGRISLVEDEEKARNICTSIAGKFTDDEEYLEKELKNAFPRVQCLEFLPEHMTGKLVNES